MQYKMQFTVLDDAVKQNRKLPEIAFFDTDGNLIHLGGDGGGDVSALLPLDGSREMSGQLGISHEDPNDGSIYLNPDGWAYFWDPTPDASVLSVAGVGTGDWPTLIVKSDGRLQWSDGTLVPDVEMRREFAYGIPGLTVETGSLSLYTTHDDAGIFVGPDADFATFSGFYPKGLVSMLSPVDAISLAIANVEDAGPNFRIKSDGSLHWGDGTDEPDTALYRSGGFGAGYGHLSADAGGGFEVMSSAPEAEGSFVQIAPDAGYGGYLWIHNLSGHTDKDALYFDVEGEANPRFKAKIDGEMLWGDGTAAPDTVLQRVADGGGLVASGVLSVAPDDALDFSGSYAYLDQLGILSLSVNGTGQNTLLVGDVTDSVQRFIMNAHGTMQWGDGASLPDVSLERVIEETGYFGLSSDPAALQIDSPIKFHERGGLAEDITLGWTSGLAHRGGPHPALAMLGEILHIEPNGDNPDGMWLTLAADPIGGNEVGLYLGGPIHNCEIKTNASGGLHYQAPEHKFDQQISIAQPGAGIKLTSPDGSQTKTVRLSNAGALELV